MVRKGNQKGFTLIEVIVVAGIIAILAGILVPMIMNQVDDAKVSKAQGDMKSIQSSIMNFKKDTSSWPTKTADAAAPATLLITDQAVPGERPTIPGGTAGWNTGVTERLINHLGATGATTYGTSWKGPYMGSAGADPWGHAYIINADQFATNNPVWIVSAGPDGRIQTGAASETCADANATPAADDICLRLK